MSDDNYIIHLSPFADWYADQDISRGVSLCDRATGQKVTRATAEAATRQCQPSCNERAKRTSEEGLRACLAVSRRQSTNYHEEASETAFQSQENRNDIHQIS